MIIAARAKPKNSSALMNTNSTSASYLWEIAIKIKTGRLNAVGSSVAYVRDEMAEYGSYTDTK